MWQGSAAICINEEQKLLMVLQGQADEDKKWAVPSGQREADEDFESCCLREVWEETGYQVQVIKHLHEKIGESYGIPVKVHYYLVRLTGGKSTLQDPDGLIYDIDWKSKEELEQLTLSFPEDRRFLIDLLEKY